jgi:glycosyltransferase involved in cell wall biosynthesis
MDEPLVSICIPCYNASPFIAETIKSVLTQTYKNIEINISDDSSTDSTLEIVKTFNDHRIKIFINEFNLGPSGNYNQALSYAKGEYTKLLCADDMLYPDCIKEQVAVFQTNKEQNIVLVTANKDIINEAGKKVFSKSFSGKKGLIEGKKAIKRSIRKGTNIFGEPGLPLFKTAVIDKKDYIITDKYYTYINDFDLWCKILLQGKLYVIDKKLFAFRIVSSSVTSNTKWKQAVCFQNYIKMLSIDKRYNITSFDLFSGKIMSWAMCFARNLVFKFYFKN